jgi:hypothetical protein
MIENPEQILQKLRRKWILLSWFSHAIVSLAIGLLAGEILHRMFGFSYLWIIPVALLTLVILLVFSLSWRISNEDVARFLDANYPYMEESTGLLLTQSLPAGSLQAMQQIKTSQVLQREYPNIQFPPKIKQALVFFAKTLFVCLVIEGIFYYVVRPLPGFTHKSPPPEAPVQTPAILSDLDIRLSPPAYTRRHPRQQSNPDIVAEEGSRLDWTLETAKPLNSLGFVFNDSEKIFLQPENKERTKWAFQRSLWSSGFYQLVLDSQVSDHYKMEMIKDLVPEIDVESPKSKTVLEYGMAEQIPLRVLIRDDYGVRSAGIVATISSGSGEAVKFSEKQIAFNETFLAIDTLYLLHKVIDLQKLGMIPGDELYFYVHATDNHGQEKKSGIYIVSLADTAELMSTGFSVSGLNVKPEYFRSERQIILETQQLLADRATIGPENYKNKSSDLGVDQKMLRLRYGKFLGEEEESGEPGKENQNGVGNPNNFGNQNLVMDAYTDKHDNAEDASFFEKETKDQLKATLTEMWNAELQLRTFNPRAALPYEYKALRLLKDLQEKSRVYVAKTGLKTTPLDFEKRLTGDPEKIQNPVEEQNASDNQEKYNQLRAALGLLQLIGSGNQAGSGAFGILQSAGIPIREKAVEEPSVYLPAYVAVQEILNDLKNGHPTRQKNIQVVENALQRLINPLSAVPSVLENKQNESLSDYYFRNLKNSP